MATTNKAFLVGNTVGNNIIRFDLASDGLLWEEFISADTGLLSDPDTLLYGPDANGDGIKDLYVTNGADLGTSSILRFDGGSGEFIDRFVGDDPTTEFNETGGLIRPYELAFGPAGNLYVASFLSDQILRYDGQTGEFIDVFAEGNGEPGGLRAYPKTDVLNGLRS
jgi:serralysin